MCAPKCFCRGHQIRSNKKHLKRHNPFFFLDRLLFVSETVSKLRIRNHPQAVCCLNLISSMEIAIKSMELLRPSPF